MATADKSRTRAALVLITLALCALFCAQGATALIAAKVLENSPEVRPAGPRRAMTSARADRRRDPTIILKRNIFDSAQGDLSSVPIEEAELPLEAMPSGEVETPCDGTLRLIGTVVIPGDLERSLAAVVGGDKKAGLHYGGSEIEEFRIRAIQSDSLILQSKGGFCRLAMFQVDGTPSPAQPVRKPVIKKREPPQRRVEVDRNAGLSPAEMAEGIERVNDRNFNVSRAMLNKVLDNAGKLIGIAAVVPKIENGQSVGMELRGVRPNTLLTKLGVQNGDILESVNGQSLSSPDAALGAYTTLRTSDKFNLTIRRGGQSMTINYTLQ